MSIDYAKINFFYFHLMLDNFVKENLKWKCAVGSSDGWRREFREKSGEEKVAHCLCENCI